MCKHHCRHHPETRHMWPCCLACNGLALVTVRDQGLLAFLSQAEHLCLLAADTKMHPSRKSSTATTGQRGK